MKSWKSCTISINSRIVDAIKNLNSSGLKISIATDNKGKIVGTVTDGDIRKALIKGNKLNTNIRKIVNKKYIAVNSKINIQEVKSMMSRYNIEQIPIIDKNNRIIGLHLSSQIMKSQNKIIKNPFIIMSGGQGKRLRPLTYLIPKPMIKINSRPMLQMIIEKAKAQGFRNFYLIVNYLNEVIENYFGNGKKFGINITYVREKDPLGTAGGLSKLKNKIKTSFVISNCDVLSSIRYDSLLEFHIKNKSSATMALSNYKWKNPFGVVRTKNSLITKIIEKPTYESFVNTGIYVLNPDVLKILKNNKSIDMTDLINKLINSKKKIFGFPVHENWLEIGDKENLDIAQKETL